jgi:hypothetical protein
MVTRIVPPARRGPPPLPADLPCAQLKSRRVICGKVARRANHPKPVQTSCQKYSAFVVGQISGFSLPVSPDERGVAHVTNARWDAVDAEGARDARAGSAFAKASADRYQTRRSLLAKTGAYGEVAWFGRRGAGAKLAIRSAGDGGKRAVLREEREVSRKAIAQGRPGCFRRTCMLVCTFAICIGTRDRGCGVHPVFPAPSSSGGQRNVQTSGERCREIAKPCPTHGRRSSAGVPWAASVGHRPAAGRCASGTSRPVPVHRKVNVARAKGDRIW